MKGCLKHILIGCFLLIGCCLTALAEHITGGEIFYTYTGFTNGQYVYHVTVKFYKDCASNRQLNTNTTATISDKASGAVIKTIVAPQIKTETISLTNPNKCITNPPAVCYVIGYYDFTL